MFSGPKAIVFVGATKFGLKCLKKILETPEVQIKGVISAPPRIYFSKTKMKNVNHANIPLFSKNKKIPCTLFKLGRENSTLLKIQKWQPDFFIVAGWYHLIPKSWRIVAPAYGMHASLLPAYRGWSPVVWAMINGESKTGITLFKMDDGIDSGPIVEQKEEPIYSDDTIVSLYNRIENRGLELLEQTLPDLAKGTASSRIQDTTGQCVMPRRGPEDGLINWNEEVTKLDRFVRAQTRPYPGAFALYKGQRLHIWKTGISRPGGFKDETGRVQKRSKGSYHVSCKGGSIELLEVSYKGKKYKKSELSDIFFGGGQRLE